METPFKPEILMQNLGPEVKSFIYQAISDFEPFCTPETVISVIAKNPLGLLTLVDTQTENENVSVTHAFDIDHLPKKTQLKKMYRIAISLAEDGSKIEAEGLHENIFEAIRAARDKMVHALTEIQNDVISSQDRHMQIREALAAGGNVH